MSVVRNEPTAWTGHLLWRPGLLSYVGEGGSSARHVHHTVQLAISFGDRFELIVGDRRVVAQAAVVPGGTPHSFETDGRRIFYALAEPLGLRGAELTRRARDLCGRDITDLIPSVTEPRADPTSLVAYTDRLVAALTQRPTDRALSPHVIAALEYLDGALQKRPRLNEAARAAHISPSRLTHLFSDQVGNPFRRFVVWLRLRRAAEFAWSAQTLTEAAIAAGFSDMAHFSRVCRSTFGVSPSALLQIEPMLGPWPV